MTMQYDVKSYHNTESGVAFASRTRLKGVLISPSTSVTFNTAICDNVPSTGTYDVPGSTTCTVTIANHGLSNGDRVYLNFTSGTAQDNTYTVANVATNTFTVLHADSRRRHFGSKWHLCWAPQRRCYVNHFLRVIRNGDAV